MRSRSSLCRAGPPVAGFDVAVLSDDGRISQVLGFLDRVPGWARLPAGPGSRLGPAPGWADRPLGSAAPLRSPPGPAPGGSGALSNPFNPTTHTSTGPRPS